MTNDKILAFKREIRVLEAMSSVYESDTFLIPGDVSGTQPVILTITVYGCVVINSGRDGAHLCPRIDSCRPALGPIVPALGSQKQHELCSEIQNGLGYRVRPSLKKGSQRRMRMTI